MTVKVLAVSIANYKWSSSLMRFSGLAPANNRTAINILAGLTAERATWSTDLEFRTAVSYTHELVHYYQDMLTGVGHWDHLMYRKFFAESFMWARQLLTLTSDFPFNIKNPKYKEADGYYKFCYDEYLKVAQNYSHEFINAKAAFVDRSTRAKALTEYLKTAFTGEIAITGDCEEFLIESLYEAEAVCNVYQTFSDIKMSTDQFDILNRNDFLVMPQKMNGVYTITLSFLESVFGDDLAKTEPTLAAQTIFFLLRFLTDLSTAYPPPGMLENSGIQKLDFDPGVKFLNLVISIHKMNAEQGDLFFNALPNKDADLAEQVLLDNCRIRYPHSKKIYSGWVNEFEKLLKEEDDILLQLRLNSCVNRVKNIENSFSAKNISESVFEHRDIPIMFQTFPEGIICYWMNQFAVDREFQENLLIDLMKWNTSMELFELFYVKGKFSCPFAESKLFCGIAKQECLSIKSLREIPNESGCLVRTLASPFL